eukprot:366131-Chlamydomonas_euryale.AAC.42
METRPDAARQLFVWCTRTRQPYEGSLLCRSHRPERKQRWGSIKTRQRQGSGAQDEVDAPPTRTGHCRRASLRQAAAQGHPTVGSSRAAGLGQNSRKRAACQRAQRRGRDAWRRTAGAWQPAVAADRGHVAAGRCCRANEPCRRLSRTPLHAQTTPCRCCGCCCGAVAACEGAVAACVGAVAGRLRRMLRSYRPFGRGHRELYGHAEKACDRRATPAAAATEPTLAPCHPWPCTAGAPLPCTMVQRSAQWAEGLSASSRAALSSVQFSVAASCGVHARRGGDGGGDGDGACGDCSMDGCRDSGREPGLDSGAAPELGSSGDARGVEGGESGAERGEAAALLPPLWRSRRKSCESRRRSVWGRPEVPTSGAGLDDAAAWTLAAWRRAGGATALGAAAARAAPAGGRLAADRRAMRPDADDHGASVVEGAAMPRWVDKAAGACGVPAAPPWARSTADACAEPM